MQEEKEVVPTLGEEAVTKPKKGRPAYLVHKGKKIDPEVQALEDATFEELERERAEIMGKWKTAAQLMKDSRLGKGRPTALSSLLLTQIRQMVLDGMGRTEIRDVLGVNKSTWNVWFWKNMHGVRDVIISAENELNVIQAKANLKDLLGEVDDRRLKFEVSKFVLEKLEESYKPKANGGIVADKVQINVVQYQPTTPIEGVKEVIEQINANNNTV